MFRARIDMNIGWHLVWVIKCADTNEADEFAQRAAKVVIAPHRDFALDAPSYVLSGVGAKIYSTSPAT